MYNRAFYQNKPNSNLANQYVLKEIMDATPQQLLLKVYNFAIVNCLKHDMVKTNNALQELINALRYEPDEVKEFSIGLLKLYRFCQDQMRARNYDIVHKILVELRDSWAEAFKK